MNGYELTVTSQFIKHSFDHWLDVNQDNFSSTDESLIIRSHTESSVQQDRRLSLELAGLDPCLLEEIWNENIVDVFSLPNRCQFALLMAFVVFKY